MNTVPTPRPMTVSLELQGAERTRLHGHWLVLVRFMWAALIVLILAFFFANLPVYFAQLHTICGGSVCAPWQLTPANARALQDAGISVSLYANFNLVLSLFSSLVWFAVAAFIAWRKSNDWLALLASLLHITHGVQQFSGVLRPPCTIVPQHGICPPFSFSSSTPRSISSSSPSSPMGGLYRLGCAGW